MSTYTVDPNEVEIIGTEEQVQYISSSIKIANKTRKKKKKKRKQEKRARKINRSKK